MAKKSSSYLVNEVPTKTADSDRGILLLRIGLGYFFIYHGLGYFFGFDPNGGIMAFAGLLAATGFPIPIFSAYLVAFIELFGGIAVLLGFFTRIFGVLLSVIAIVAFVTVHHFTPGLEKGGVDILALAASLSLMIAGPGTISLAERWYREDLMRPKDVVENGKVSKEEAEGQKEMVIETKKTEQEGKKKEEEVVFPVNQKAELKKDKKDTNREQKNKTEEESLEDFFDFSSHSTDSVSEGKRK